MVSLSEMNAISHRAKADPEMRNLYAFLFREVYDSTLPSRYAHVRLLNAVALRKSGEFQQLLEEFKLRQAAEGTGWYDDDSLVFLLLIGCELFKSDRDFLNGILNARDRNSNPIPKRVTEVFRALQRREFGIRGTLFHQNSFFGFMWKSITGR